MIIGFARISPEECVARLWQSSFPQFQERRPCSQAETPPPLLVSMSDSSLRGRLFSNRKRIELSSFQWGSIQGTKIKIQSFLPRAAVGALFVSLALVAFVVLSYVSGASSSWEFGIGDEFSLGTALLSLLPAVVCVVYLWSRSNAEGRMWNELRKKLEPLDVVRLDGMAWTEDRQRRIVDIMGAVILWSVVGGLGATLGFPIPLLLLILIPLLVGGLFRALFPSAVYETTKKRQAIMSSWSEIFSFFWLLSYGGLVAVWNWTSRAAMGLSEIVAPGDSLSIAESFLAPLSAGEFFDYSWFPFVVTQSPLRPDELFFVVTYGRPMSNDPSPISTIAWGILAIALLLVAYKSWRILDERRSFMREFSSYERSRIDTSARGSSSITFRSVLIITFSVHLLAMVVTGVTVAATVGAILAPDLFQRFVFGLPIAQLVMSWDYIGGPIPPQTTALLSLGAGAFLLAGIGPGLAFMLFEEIRSRSLLKKWRCHRQDLLDWVADYKDSTRYRGDIHVVAIPSAQLDERYRLSYILYLTFFGILRRNALIVIDREVLEDAKIPRDVLFAALAHEIEHARLDSRWMRLLERLSIISGLGRGFLSLYVDRLAIEDRADDEACDHIHDKQALVKAIRMVEIRQAVQYLASMCDPSGTNRPKGTVFRELLDALKSILGSFMLSGHYRDMRSRIQRIEEHGTGAGR